MTLENMLRKKLADAATASQPSASLPHQGWTATLRPEANDALSCSLGELALDRDAPPADGDPRAWGERISRKVTGLLEPLKLLEADAARQVAVLRSSAPTPKDPGLHYYEVELHGTARATVRRFRGFHETGKKREPIPFTVTYEALAKLIDDVTATA
jgi:hypothetical protein